MTFTHLQMLLLGFQFGLMIMLYGRVRRLEISVLLLTAVSDPDKSEWGKRVIPPG